MAKIVTWTSEKAQVELKKRFEYCKQNRRDQEYRWSKNEISIYSNTASGATSRLSYSFESEIDFGLEDVDNANADVKVNYSFKNLRFIHAQLSANPPSVVPRPASNDQEDRRKAQAADKLIHHALRQYKMQEVIDRASLNCLVYGTGFVKTIWDAEQGDITEFDEDTGEITLEGDIAIRVPHTWNMFVDPDSNCWDEVRFVFERIVMPFEEALFKWPEKKEILQKSRLVGEQNFRDSGEAHSELNKGNYDAVELFEYWEKGLPTNGYLGRYSIMSRDGSIVEDPRPNPFRFRASGAVSDINKKDISDDKKEALIKRIPMKAKLPYHIFTDIDVPNNIWGKSFVEYTGNLQDIMNRLDATNLDNVQAHGVARMVLPEGAEVASESITNSPWDIIKITGNQPPFFARAPSIMPEVGGLREQMRVGIDDMAGVNEAMFGQQSREQSGFSMQYATNQGNMIRRRLFNKYVLFVESIYKSFLNLVRQHWDIDRTILVLGNEKALQAVEIKGADIDGGFDLVVEYGASLSLDPMTRREEILTLQPLFEKAGVPPRVSLQMLKLNEMDGMYDMLQLADDRQREYFEAIIASETIIAPEEFEDHENMIAYAYRYFMTTEFKYLDPEIKELCREHIRQRAQMAAQEKMPGAQPGGTALEGPAAPGPAPEGMAGEAVAPGAPPEAPLPQG